MRGFVAFVVCIVSTLSPCLGQTAYQKAPPAIAKVLDAPMPPTLSLSPRRDRALVLEQAAYPPISALAKPMLRLAGLRIDATTNGPHNPPRIVRMTLRALDGSFSRKIELPSNAAVGGVTWSPDGKRFLFTNTAEDRIELWIGEAASGDVRRVEGVKLNAVLGDPVDWLGSDKILAKALPAERGDAPKPPTVPAGPTIQEGYGKAAPVRTYQDLLTNAYDEDLFDYVATAQVAVIDAQTGAVQRVGEPGVIWMVEPSPDHRHLLVSRIHRPYSYWHTLYSFPRRVEVWDVNGKVVHVLADLPLADAVPIEGVPTGPRGYRWRPSAGSTLVWAEALDEGDPRKKVEARDRLMTLAAPFSEKPREIVRLKHRYSGVEFAADGRALISHYDRDRKWVQTLLVDLDGDHTAVVWDLSSQDRYGDPGEPLHRRLENGASVMWQDGDAIFLSGRGASPEGERPFLDRFNLRTREMKRLFHSAAGSYETVAALVSDDGRRFITRRESATEPPNYFVVDADGSRTPQTDYKDPSPELRGIRKQLVTYERGDGVKLSFTLYLPPDYKDGERRPTVVWAYPREYAAADTAGQVTGSPHRFTMLYGTSHLFLLLAGYVVLDGATMPVVGPPETANDTYVQQIVASAKSAIDKAVELGVTDAKRVGVMGHSYGAFMTANLLAHSDLFRAGVARSGAYNRTLTPFGFQSERRTLWEAPQIYASMSAFYHADKLKEPLLLIHGAMDDNSGTFPMQSERLYQALRGNGGNVRLVMLPHESHGYVARESVEHVLWETVRWFDRYLKE